MFQLEYGPAWIVIGATDRGSSVEIARRVENKATVGRTAGLKVEAEQNFFDPKTACFRRQLKYGPGTMKPPECGRAIEIPSGIHDQGGPGLVAVCAVVGELMQDLL